jgi:hypothetical protein
MQAIRLIAIGGLSLGLCACAGTGGARPTSQLPADYDATKVAVVTQWAKTKGATVIWINYPTVPHPRDGG